MIPFNFDYYQPFSIREVLQLYQTLIDSQKRIILFGGGTEFITFARTNSLQADAVIDLKGIPECHVLEQSRDEITIGSAVTLNQMIKADIYPLLSQTLKQVADHTSRNKITIGGHVNSQLKYREGLLPLLLSEANAIVAGSNGERIIALGSLLHQGGQMEPGDLLIQIKLDKKYTTLPYVHYKKTRLSKIGYPLISIAALKQRNKISAAFGGLCPYPFRDLEIETILNDTSLSPSARTEKALQHLPAPIVKDQQGSDEYRKFVFTNGMVQVLKDLEAVN